MNQRIHRTHIIQPVAGWLCCNSPSNETKRDSSVPLGRPFSISFCLVWFVVAGIGSGVHFLLLSSKKLRLEKLL